MQLENEAKLMKQKIAFEKEIADWKTLAEEKKIEKAANEWKLEKELLEKQLSMAKAQMEENKKLHESLKSAIDKASKPSPDEEKDQAHLLEVNKAFLIRKFTFYRIYQQQLEEWKKDHKS